MKRDMELIRQILLQIEQKSDGTNFFSIDTIDGYSDEIIDFHLSLIEEAGLINKLKKLIGGQFLVNRLSNTGYDFLEKIKNEEVWEQTKTEIRNKKLPETVEFISKIAGIFVGNLLGNIN